MKLSITDSARAQLEAIEERGEVPKICTQASGCCGSYKLTVIGEKPRPSDELNELDGVRFIIDERAKPLLWDATLDYRRNGLFKGFVIR